MSLSSKIREQLISSFRTELAEHVQTMTNGLLALEQHQVTGEQRRTTLEDVFRAAHSLKGASRAVGVTVIEQLAHALEDVLTTMQDDSLELTSELFSTCYRALDAIQAVQAAYESGQTTPPVQALQVLADLESFRSAPKATETAKVGKNPESVVLEQVEARVDSGPLPVSAPVIPPETPPTTATGPVPELPATAPAHTSDETIRVSVSKLDALMSQLSELVVTKMRAEQRLLQVRQAHDFMTQWQKEWLSARSAHSRLIRQTSGAEGAPTGEPSADVLRLLTYVSNSQDHMREMGARIATLLREYDNDTMHMSLVIDVLEQEVKRVRMLPLSTITVAFGRMVRDLAQTAGKEAVLQIVGGEVELDKRVLEQIKDPLIHLLRNAIDHGIEMPDQRVKMGKPRQGTITLSAQQLGKDVVISVLDDGTGLNLEAIRRAVLRRGGVGVQGLSEADLADLIFNAGFSTSPIITDVSGRGLGLDVVRRNIEALSGRVNVTWRAGVGTTFQLTLPLTLTSSRALLVDVSKQVFAIPFNTVQSILMVTAPQISALGGHDALRLDGRPIPLVRLSDVLDLPRTSAPAGEREVSEIPVVILAVSERRVAFVVDGLAGEQEVVIKGLGRQLARVAGVAGATVMGSGEVTLILNAADLIRLAMRAERRPVFEGFQETVEERPKTRILIVDDSITTRTLEKNILEAAGYVIQIATDGQEALNTIAAGAVPDLVISDVSMPRLDGFGLTERLKNDPRTSGVPVILVTSLDSTQHKARGIEVGADAYILKSGFDQNNLLETIEQLI